MTDMKYITYCGLYCRLCSTLARIPQQASALRETLEKGGWEYFGEYCMSGFKEFWAGLKELSESDKSCGGCRGGCGDPDCAIRKCAQEKGIELCSSCADYPCPHIENLAKKYPNLIPDGTRQREIGIRKWIEEQEERCRAGFCYGDIQYPC